MLDFIINYTLFGLIWSIYMERSNKKYNPDNVFTNSHRLRFTFLWPFSFYHWLKAFIGW